jgi:CHAT domain-containing protein/tetratricopeptide (TPR) repeat protein
MARGQVGVGRWWLLALGVLLAGASAGRAAAPPALGGSLTTQDRQQIAKLQSRVNGHAWAGRFEEATEALQQIAELRQRRQGRRHWQTIDARLVAWNWGRLAKVAKEDRPQVLQALRRMSAADGLAARHDYRGAEKAQREALAIYRKVLGEEHPLTASRYGAVAFYLRSQGQQARALDLYRKALAIDKKVLGQEHSETAASYNSVAACLDDLGQHAKALPLYQKALDINKKVLGPEHPSTAASYNNVAFCLNAQGEFGKAFPLYQQALDIFKKVLGEEHPRTAVAYTNLGVCLSNQGQHARALVLYQKALDLCQKVLGELHPHTAVAYNNVAACLKAQGQHAKALLLHQKGLAIRKKLLGQEHPHTANSYNNMARCLDSLGQSARALTLYQKALEIRKKVLGEEHPDTARSYNNLASCLHAQGRYAKALPLYQKALAIRKKVLGQTHPSTATSYNNVAHCLYSQGQHAKALPLFQKALDIDKKVLGEQHPRTAATYNNVAFCLSAQGKYAEAAKEWRAALLGREVGRLQAASSGFLRAQFEAGKVSPRAALAACLARLGQPLQAWQHAEARLARGLLDDLDADQGDPSSPDVRLAYLQQLDSRLLPLLALEKPSEQQKQRLQELSHERRQLLAALAREAGERAARRVLPLASIQKHIPADAALVFWLDVESEHWACVLRHKGPPAWQRLPGSGPRKKWTRTDTVLPAQAYSALLAGAARSAERQRLLEALGKQRLMPLQPHLKATRSLPAVRRLLVVPTGLMARVPVEALTERYAVSYVPSGSVFARLMEKHRKLQPSTLLALGDPVFTSPTLRLPEPPSHGLLLKAVLPGGAAARANLHSGDVLLDYDGRRLKSLKDLRLRDATVRATFWRDGQESTARLTGRRLGAVLDARPAAEAVKAWRETEFITRGAKRYQGLPGTRQEVQALSRLVPGATTLLGSAASEQSLARLVREGKLRRFRLLHLATHGEVNDARPEQSALILAQDRLPARKDDEVAAILSGRKPLDGRLTVDTIRRTWKLDADLVVLSACQSGLGQDAGGNGLLGFAQALLARQAHSVVLSRWKVDDSATSLLMLRFYENLLSKRKGLKKPMRRAEALAEAQQWLRTLRRKQAEPLVARLAGGKLRGTIDKPLLEVKGKPARLPRGERPFAAPYYWAAFVLIGDPF